MGGLFFVPTRVSNKMNESIINWYFVYWQGIIVCQITLRAGIHPVMRLYKYSNIYYFPYTFHYRMLSTCIVCTYIYIYHLSILLDMSHFRIGLVNHSGFRPRPWLPGVPVKPLAGWLRPSRAGSWRQRWVIKQITSDYHLGSGKLFHIYIYMCVYIYICDIYVFIFFITNWLCCN